MVIAKNFNLFKKINANVTVICQFMYVVLIVPVCFWNVEATMQFSFQL